MTNNWKVDSLINEVLLREEEPRWMKMLRKRDNNVEARPSKTNSSKFKLDRFIPSQETESHWEQAHYALTQSIKKTNVTNNAFIDVSPSKQTVKRNLADNLSIDNSINNNMGKIFNFSGKEKSRNIKMLNGSFREPIEKRKSVKRSLPTQAEKVLDAVDIVDDYYLNNMDWSKSGVLAIALGNSVYTYNERNSQTSLIFESDDEETVITSLKWNPSEHNLIVIGNSLGEIFLVDSKTTEIVRKYKNLRRERITSIAWNNKNEFASGSKDGLILLHDIISEEDSYAQLIAHTDEVCGLEWNPSGEFLCSGGNDNLLLIWEPKSNVNQPLHRITSHTAAIKAIAWNPRKPYELISGGGLTDKTIRLWRISKQCCLCIDTVMVGSQITSLQYGNDDEVISGLGFTSNAIQVWKVGRKLESVGIIKGHSKRVLNLCVNPDKTYVVSSSADETLMFWKLWDKKYNNSVSGMNKLSSKTSLIR